MERGRRGGLRGGGERRGEEEEEENEEGRRGGGERRGRGMRLIGKKLNLKLNFKALEGH